MIYLSISLYGYVLFRKKKSDEWGKYVYTKPWCRAQPYLVGFILGYYIYRSSEQYYNRRRRLAVFWVSAHGQWPTLTTLTSVLIWFIPDAKAYHLWDCGLIRFSLRTRDTWQGGLG
jgi:hypothetical protein